jgi:site-specific DNA-methyltransferase (adenine-specific)
MPDISGDGWQVFHGSCLDRLLDLPDNSIDAVVCDPPYELGFMGKKWDSSGIAFNVAVWEQCLRVLKPGGHLLAFGGSRTWHRLAVAIEDAGFELRDSIAWLYGSGFPKSLDVSKAIDKAAGAEREVVGSKLASPKGISGAEARTDTAAGAYGGEAKMIDITAPATPEAVKWQGWGTALKPAFEPVVVARKPVEGTVANNVLVWGVGGLNIDATRIGTDGGNKRTEFDDIANNGVYGVGMGQSKPASPVSGLGRWPSNVMLDEYTAALVDEQSGVSKDGTAVNRNRTGKKPNEVYAGGWGNIPDDVGYNGSGGASRFFYVAKASKKDRNEGLDNLEGKSIGDKGNGLARTCATCGASVIDGCDCPDRTFVNPTRQNFHPTVKPTDLMRQLIRLVTPPGGTVLDPFTGSGSTGKAALLEGFTFIGCELTEDYLPIIEGRLNHAVTTNQTQDIPLF